jgi:hypothetical protein
MPRPVSESLLRALVGEARSGAEGNLIIAVEAAPDWPGSEVIESGVGPIRVAPCVSALAVRDVISHWERKDSETLVILTDRDERDLGEEVLARVWRNRLQRPSGWPAIQHLFRVDRLDPALAEHRWLVDLLVGVAPVHGYPPPPSGFLDIATAWRTLLRHGLRIDVEQPMVVDLLRWGRTDAARAALNGALGEHLEQISARLAADVGPAAPHLLRLVAGGRGGDLIPFGLVCDVLWSHGSDFGPQVVAARARFETPLGARSLGEPAARSWAEAATEIVREAAEAGETQLTSTWLTRAEHLLGELDAVNLAVASDVLPVAFTQRLRVAGELLAALLDDPDAEALSRLSDAFAHVDRHFRASLGEDAERVRRLRMGVRLARRHVSAAERTPPRDLGEAATLFIDDGAWVDAAREAIGDGETVETLAAAYGRLASLVDEERRDRDRAFAAAFAAWNRVLPTTTEALLPIERVLDEIVVPVAKHARVLLLVLDGLSYPEAIRLFGDLASEGWTPNIPGGVRLPHIVAAVPTVTTVSRTSLLTGRLATGNQETERVGFADHRALRDASGGQPPRLFHKRDLGTEFGRIAPEVRDTILDPEQHVVGVVVNAIDDHLAKGGQLRLAEGLQGVKPLRPLLAAAAEARRAVVLASDHGHVIEYGSRARPVSGGGERWRPATSPPGEDEVEISGPRVLLGDGRIIAPVTESIRYMAADKRGYHGGATPQEALCPLVVLTSGAVTLAGWQPAAARRPAWWDPEVPLLRVPDLPVPAAPEPIIDHRGQAAMFADDLSVPARAVEVGGWIGVVLSSPVFEQQRKAAGRTALDEEDVARFLAILEVAGGTAPGPALSEAVGLPPSRLRTKLEALRRMLNVDGYPVLALEPDGTARLNRELLATQFEVDL